MAARARYYDGKVAMARIVTVRPTRDELVILDSDGSNVVARWPAPELVVLGDTAHEKAPPVVRKPHASPPKSPPRPLVARSPGPVRPARP